MRRMSIRVASSVVSAVLLVGLFPVSASGVASVIESPTATPHPSPEVTSSPEVTPAPETPVASETAEPTPTDLPEPTPSDEPSPSPSVAPEDDVDYGHDGPTEPLTREQPVFGVRMLTSPSPQPVFRFPFAPGSRWGVSGSHADSDGIHRGAIDFAPLSSSDRAVRAVASGTVYRVTCGSGWFLGIDHGGGWASEYYHLTNAQSSLVGSWVEAGTYLGTAGQTLPCGGTPGNSAHVHLSILNTRTVVPSGKRQYVPVHGVQFDNYVHRDLSGAYNGVWRNLSGKVVVTARGVTCCLTARSRVGPTGGSTALDSNGNGIPDITEVTAWDTDLNDDGRPDLVAFKDKVWTSLNETDEFGSPAAAQGGFGTNNGWSNSTHLRMLADVNGDGRPDLVGFKNDGAWVALGNGKTFGAARKWSSSFGRQSGWDTTHRIRTVADVTGDGRADIIGFANGGVYVARSTGSGFAAPTYWTREMGLLDSAGGWTATRHPREIIDVTGDGLADIVGFGEDGVYVAANTGRGGFAALKKWTSSYSAKNGWLPRTHIREVVDMNGDGRPDIVGLAGQGVYVSLNTGSSFGSAKLWTSRFGTSPSSGGWNMSRQPRVIADVTGDGLPDIVGFTSSGTYVGRNTKSGFASPARWTANFGSTEWTAGRMPRSVTDVNGDGRADIVGFAGDGVHVALSTGSRFQAATHWSQRYGHYGTSGSWSTTTHLRGVAIG